MNRYAILAAVLACAGCLEPADDFTDGRSGQLSTVAPANKTQVDAGATVLGAALTMASTWRSTAGHPSDTAFETQR